MTIYPHILRDTLSVLILLQTITFAIHDLCIHPEYVEPLRRELQLHYRDFEATAQGLPLLDSFIKESARLTPVESSKYIIVDLFSKLTSVVSTRRCALQAFMLSDGTKLNAGDWACTPVRSIMQSSEHYPSPLSFNAFRFVDPQLLEGVARNKTNFVSQPTPSKLANVSNSWNVWGTGRMAWYVSHFLQHLDT